MVALAEGEKLLGEVELEEKKPPFLKEGEKLLGSIELPPEIKLNTGEKYLGSIEFDETTTTPQTRKAGSFSPELLKATGRGIIRGTETGLKAMRLGEKAPTGTVDYPKSIWTDIKRTAFSVPESIGAGVEKAGEIATGIMSKGKLGKPLGEAVTSIGKEAKEYWKGKKEEVPATGSYITSPLIKKLQDLQKDPSISMPENLSPFLKGYESTVHSLTSTLPAAAVGAVSPSGKAMLVKAMAGGILGGGTIFGAAKYDEIMELGRQYRPDMPEKELKSLALEAGLWEGVTETALDVVVGKFLGLLGADITTPIKETIKKTLKPSMAKQFFKNVAKITPIALAEEKIQEAGDVRTHKILGAPFEKDKDLASTVTVSSILFAAIGVGGQRIKANTALKTLSDPNAKIENRTMLVNEVGNAIFKKDKEAAINWVTKAQEAVYNGQPIDINEKVFDKSKGKRNIPEQFETTGEPTDLLADEAIIEDKPVSAEKVIQGDAFDIESYREDIEKQKAYETKQKEYQDILAEQDKGGFAELSKGLYKGIGKTIGIDAHTGLPIIDRTQKEAVTNEGQEEVTREGLPLPEKLSNAIGKPNQAELLKKLPEKQQIDQIVKDAVTQPLNTAKIYEKKGKVQEANELKAAAFKNADKLIEADGATTEALVDKALRQELSSTAIEPPVPPEAQKQAAPPPLSKQAFIAKIKGKASDAKDINTWVLRKGGINYEGEHWKGELRDLRDALNQGKRMGYGNKIVKSKGAYTLDELAIMAKDEGFLTEATPQALLDAMHQRKTTIAQAEELPEPSAPKAEIDIAKLKEGDKVFIDGEEYQHKGFDENNNIILRDGLDYTLDAFDKFEVDATPEGKPIVESYKLKVQEVTKKSARAAQLDLAGAKTGLEGKLPSTEIKGNTALEQATEDAKTREAQKGQQEIEEKPAIQPLIVAKPRELHTFKVGDVVDINGKKVKIVSNIKDSFGEPQRVSVQPIEKVTKTIKDKTFQMPQKPYDISPFTEIGEGGAKLAVEKKQTDTPAFKEWFGNSKVVNDKGEPLVVYHGTPKGGFSSFDSFRIGTNTGTPSEGFYFTENKRNAETYSGKKDEVVINQEAFDEGDKTAGIYSAYLSLKNPLEVDFEGRNWDGMGADGTYDRDAEGMNDYVNMAKERGHDGLIAKNLSDEGRFGQGYNWGEITYVAFSPTQVKSATGNVGTFDPKNPDIRFSAAKPSPESVAVAEDVIKNVFARIDTILGKGTVSVGFKPSASIIDALSTNIKQKALGEHGLSLSDKFEVAGLYQHTHTLTGNGLKHIITLAEELKNRPKELKRTSFHEGWHGTEEILESLASSGNQEAKNILRALKSEIQLAEARADAFADFGMKKAETGLSAKVRAIFERIMQFFRQLGDYLTDKGITSKAEVNAFFEKVWKGEFADKTFQMPQKPYDISPFTEIGEGGGKLSIENELIREARKYKSAEEFVEAQQQNIFYHGSPTGELGIKEIHIGTKEAAKQALEARIGIPADGKGWDGNTEYGKTLLAGKKTLKKLDPKEFNLTGFNTRVPNEDFYVKDYLELAANAVFSDGSKIPLTAKPKVFPVKVKGEMTNYVSTPMSDVKANATIKAMLKKGQAKRGYYYKNTGEDVGSISAIVPSSEHLEIFDKKQLIDIWNKANNVKLSVDEFADFKKSMEAGKFEAPTEKETSDYTELLKKDYNSLTDKERNVVNNLMADEGMLSIKKPSPEVRKIIDYVIEKGQMPTDAWLNKTGMDESEIAEFKEYMKGLRGKRVGRVTESIARKTAQEAYKQGKKEVKTEVSELKEEQKVENSVKRLLKMKKSMSVDYQKVLLELSGEGKKINPDAVRKLSQWFDGINSEDIGMPETEAQEIKEKLSGISDKSFNDLTTAEKTTFADVLKQLKAHDRFIRKIQLTFKGLDRADEIQRVLKSTVSLDAKEGVFREGTKEMYVKSLTASRVANMLDNFKDSGVNQEYIFNQFITENEAGYQAVEQTRTFMEKAMAIKNEWTEDELQRITVNALGIMGAESQRDVLMEEFGLEEVPALTKEENALMNLIEETMNENKQDIKAVFESRENQIFPEIARYIFPLKYEKQKDIVNADILRHDYHRTKESDDYFTEQRVKGVKKLIRTDLFNIVREGLQAQNWYFHMQPVLDAQASVLFSKQYKAQAGDAGYRWWKDQIDIVARRGYSAKSDTMFTKTEQMLKEGRINLNKAVMAYKASSAAMQIFSAFDAMAYGVVAGKPLAAAKIPQNIIKAWFFKNPELYKMSKAIQLRDGGEQAFKELIDKGMDKYSRAGFKPLKEADLRTALGVLQTYYDALGGTADKLNQAELMMTLSQGGTSISLRPHVLASGEVMRTAFTFQTFFLNRWGIVAHDIINKSIIHGDARQKIRGANAIAIIIMASMLEDDAREYLYSLITGKKYKDVSTMRRVFSALPESIPLVGRAISAIIQGRQGDTDVPIVRSLKSGIKGAYDIVMAEEGAKKAQGALKALETLLSVKFGVPGTAQIFDLIESALPETKGQTNQQKAYYNRKIAEAYIKGDREKARELRREN